MFVSCSIDLSRSLHAVTALADRAADRILRQDHGLSYRRFLALYAVTELGTPTQRQLAERLGLTEPSVSRMVQVLEKAGLVAVSTESGGNRRRLALTRQGAALVKRAGSDLEDRFAGVLERSRGELRGVPRGDSQTAARTGRIGERPIRRVSTVRDDDVDGGETAQAMTRRDTRGGWGTGEPSVAIVESDDGTAIAVHSVGAGAPVIVVGGAMRTAEDYRPVAASLAHGRQVHVLERRGRGASGPLRADHVIERDCEDLLAVQAMTGASDVFGHSYGGLVVLETARRHGVFERIAVYEPAVSIDGSIPTAWTDRYRELLEAGRPRAAFAHFVQQSGHAPSVVTRLPLWYLSVVMRLVVRGQQWQRFLPLLDANIVEHAQVAACDTDVDRYAGVGGSVLLLGGSRSPGFAAAALLDRLHNVIPQSTVEIIDGLDHNAPDEKAPDAVATYVSRFLAGAR